MGKAEKADGYGKWTYGAYKVNGCEVFHVVTGGVLTKQVEVTAKARELGAVIPDDTAWHCERDESDKSGRLFYITGGYKLEDIALPLGIGPFYRITRKLRLSRALPLIMATMTTIGSPFLFHAAVENSMLLQLCLVLAAVGTVRLGALCLSTVVSGSIIDDTGAEVFGHWGAPLSKELSVRCRHLLNELGEQMKLDPSWPFNKTGIHVRQAPKGWAVTEGNLAREHAGTPTAVTREQWINAIDKPVESWFESPLVTTRMVTPTIVSEPTASPAAVSDAIHRVLPGTPVGDTLASLSPSELETTMKRVRSL
jgi:hypothetical protein